MIRHDFYGMLLSYTVEPLNTVHLDLYGRLMGTRCVVAAELQTTLLASHVSE